MVRQESATIGCTHRELGGGALLDLGIYPLSFRFDGVRVTDAGDCDGRS